MIKCWKIRTNGYIDQVQQQFNCCLNDKKSKINQYKTHLEDKISCGRVRIQKKLEDVRKN